MQLRLSKSFAVGQGGLILESRSQDSKSDSVGWGPTDTKLPQDVLKAWDFHAVCCVANKVWIVGRPGSAVLHSDDLGVSWKVSKTGQTLPLNAVHFFDANRGWAVGEFGTILASGDGGKTWTVQRRGGQRAAVLCVHARAEDLPVDTVAMLGGEQGLLTAVLRVAAADFKSDPFSESAQPQRLAGADRAAAGAAAETLWQFPSPQHFAGADKADVLKYWDRMHGDRAAQELLRQLVLALRMWQPDLVLGDHPDFKTTGNAASALIAEALHEACKQAADPKAFPEQIEQLDLKPWRVTRYYGLWDKRGGSHVSIDNTREAPQLQATYAEYAGAASALLGAAPPALPTERFFRMLATTKADAPNNLLDGVNFGPAGQCRRHVPAVVELDSKLAAAVKAQRQMLVLAKNPVAGLAESPQLLGQMGTLLAKLPEDRAAKAASAIASEFARQGQWELARDAYLEIITRYPLHPLSVDACRWLIRFNSSSEARRRKELGQFLVAPVTPRVVLPSAIVDPKTAEATQVKPAVKIGQDMTPEQLKAVAKELKSNDVALAGFFITDPSELLHWHKGSLLLAKQLAGFGKLYAGDPSIQFCLQSSKRKLGDFKSAYEFYSATAPNMRRAHGERWRPRSCGLPTEWDCRPAPWPFAGRRQPSLFSTAISTMPAGKGKNRWSWRCRPADRQGISDGGDAVIRRSIPVHCPEVQASRWPGRAASQGKAAGCRFAGLRSRQHHAGSRPRLFDLLQSAGRSTRLRLRGLLGRHPLGPQVVRGHPQRGRLLADRGRHSTGGADRRADYQGLGMGLQHRPHTARPRRAGLVPACRRRAATGGNVLDDVSARVSLCEKGSGTFCRNGPKGAAHKRCLTPFRTGSNIR